MQNVATLGKYSIGIGDRFGCQGEALLTAVIEARRLGVDVTPVWNKSYREHSLIGTIPEDVRREADSAVKALDWHGPYFVDADHITLQTVDYFVTSSDFFTLDVSEYIGTMPSRSEGIDDETEKFVSTYRKYMGELSFPGTNEVFYVTPERIRTIARKYLPAILQAAKICKKIEQTKGSLSNYIIELSMDETLSPQTPLELFFILAGVHYYKVPLNTIAPKFSGRFNKGVDYAGDINQFAAELNLDMAVISFAIKEFGLNPYMKLSVHSGSDKFSLYEIMHNIIKKRGAGLHLKTAGTTWLEELAGLATCPDGLEICKQIYEKAYYRREELCKPYSTVIDIDPSKLPTPEVVKSWSSYEFISALRHDQGCSQFNPHLRQLLHVGYKIAAEMKETYLEMVRSHKNTISTFVTENILERHLKPIFLGRQS